MRQAAVFSLIAIAAFSISGKATAESFGAPDGVSHVSSATQNDLEMAARLERATRPPTADDAEAATDDGFNPFAPDEDLTFDDSPPTAVEPEGWTLAPSGPEAPRHLRPDLRFSLRAAEADALESSIFDLNGRDLRLDVSGGATWRIENAEGAVEISSRLGWRADIPDEEPRCLGMEFMDFVTACNKEGAAAANRYMLVTKDVASTSWRTYVGFAMKFDAGMLVDVSYKNFNDSGRELEKFMNAEHDDLSDRGVVMSLSMPFGQ